MQDSQHPDEVSRLRFALWGERAALGEEAERHVETCAACSDDVAYHRRLRDAFRRFAGAEPSEGAVAIAKAAAADPGRDGAIEWIAAEPVGGLGGVRSAGMSDVHVVCDTGGLALDVVLHADESGARFAVSGQALRSDFTPAEGVDVTLFVDRRRAADATTDPFGEFEFGLFEGERWGLRVGTGPRAAHIEILPGGGGA